MSTVSVSCEQACLRLSLSLSCSSSNVILILGHIIMDMFSVFGCSRPSQLWYSYSYILVHTGRQF